MKTNICKKFWTKIQEYAMTKRESLQFIKVVGKTWNPHAAE
jgi:hypothetical protein